MKPYEAILEVLAANAVAYEELDHEPVYTSQQAANVSGLSLNAGAKSLLLKADDSFVLIVISGSQRLDSKKLKIALGAKKLRFATAGEVSAKMHCEIGSCYPFGSIINLKTYVDKSLLSQQSISFNPGLHTKSVKLSLRDYLLIEKPQEIAVSAD